MQADGTLAVVATELAERLIVAVTTLETIVEMNPVALEVVDIQNFVSRVLESLKVDKQEVGIEVTEDTPVDQIVGKIEEV